MVEKTDNDPQNSSFRRRLAIAALLITIIMVVMDGVAIAMILPELAREFDVDNASVTWVINGYQLVIIGLLFPMAAASQILGYRAIYMAGIFLFGAFALASVFSTNLPMLIASRSFQAVGAAAIMGVNLALWRLVVPPAKLGRMIGINATTVALAATSGPLVSGLILTELDWRFVLALPAPAMVVSLLLALFSFPQNIRIQARLDYPSSLLNIAAFAGLILTLSGLGQGWMWQAVAMFAIVSSAAFLMLFLRLRSVPYPLLPIDLLARPMFALSIGASVCAFAIQMIVYVAMPFLLLGERGQTAFSAGLIFSMWPLALAMASLTAARLSERFGEHVVCSVSFVILIGGLSCLAFTDPATSTAWIAAAMGICGVGFGLFQPSNNKILIMIPPLERASAASGALGTARLFGQALGTSIAGIGLSLGLENSWPAIIVSAMLFGAFGILFCALRLRSSRT